MADLEAERALAAKLTGGALLVRGDSLGSAVMVQDRVLTAAHVVVPENRESVDLDALRFDVGIGRQRFTCRLHAFEPVHDIAVLDPLDASGAVWVPRFSVSSDAQIGDPIWIGGYPFGTEVPVVRRGSIASIVMPEETIVVDRNMFASRNAGFPAYWVDVPVFPGNSGGPVLNRNGDLIGLAIQTLKADHAIEPEETAGVDSKATTPRFRPVPVYLDVGVVVRLDLALGRTELDKHLSRTT